VIENALDPILGGGGLVTLHIGRQAFGKPGMNAAIQPGVTLMADTFQYPQQAPGPAAALVVAGHHMGIRGQAKVAEKRFQ